MKLNRILRAFSPKDPSFHPLFMKGVVNLQQTADELKLLLSTNTKEQQEVHVRRIKELERDGDTITDTILEQLSKSFITPFDREDIQELATSIDDVVDTINGTAQRIFLYQAKTNVKVYIDFANILCEAAREIELSVQLLTNPGKNKDQISQACLSVKTLESNADDLYHKGIISLFEDEKDPFELIKMKEILETLERAVDRTKTVADSIKTILIKMA